MTLTADKRAARNEGYSVPGNGVSPSIVGRVKHPKVVSAFATDSAADPPYYCELCNSRFATVKLLEVHSVTAHRRRLFACRNCELYYTFDAAEYHRHRACIHGEVVGGEAVADVRMDASAVHRGMERFGYGGGLQRDRLGNRSRPSASLLSMLTQNANNVKSVDRNYSSSNGALDLSSDAGHVYNNATEDKCRDPEMQEYLGDSSRRSGSKIGSSPRGSDAFPVDIKSSEYSSGFHQRGSGTVARDSGNRILPAVVDNLKQGVLGGSGNPSSDVDNCTNRVVVDEKSHVISLIHAASPQHKSLYKPQQTITPKQVVPTGNSSDAGSSLSLSRTNSPPSRKYRLEGRSPNESLIIRSETSSPVTGISGGFSGGRENPVEMKRRRMGKMGLIADNQSSLATVGKKAEILPRSNKVFYCPLCPEREPFRYRKSFDKHMRQHAAGVASLSVLVAPSVPQQVQEPVPPSARTYFPPQSGGGVYLDSQRQSQTDGRGGGGSGGGGPSKINVYEDVDENSFESDESDALAYRDDPSDRDYK